MGIHITDLIWGEEKENVEEKGWILLEAKLWNGLAG